MSAPVATEVWSTYAHHWGLLAPPLRPSPEDVLVVARVAAEHARALGRPLRVLLLGVTPELATLDWRAGTSLVAVDRSEGMIRAVWPSRGVPERASALCGDWLSMPLDDASVDLVLGDGIYNVLLHRQYPALTAEVRRVLGPRGLFVPRAFIAPSSAERETVRRIGEDLGAARIQGFHALKWRLVMALQPSLAEGVRVADVWRAWTELCPSREALAAKHGWDLATIGSIDAYRDAATTYTFPTLAELRAEVASAFEEGGCHVPPYELGERCPTLVLRAR